MGRRADGVDGLAFAPDRPLYLVDDFFGPGTVWEVVDVVPLPPDDDADLSSVKPGSDIAINMRCVRAAGRYTSGSIEWDTADVILHGLETGEYRWLDHPDDWENI